MKEILTFIVTPKNDYLFISQKSGLITILDEKYNPKLSIKLEFDVENIEFLGDKDLVIISGEKTILYKTNDLLNGNLTELFHFRQVFQLISYQNERLITVTENGKIQQWDLKNFDSKNIIDTNSFVYSLKQTDKYLYFGVNKKLVCYDLEQSKVKNEINVPGDIFSISNRKDWIIVGGAFFSIYLYYQNKLVAVLPTSSYCYDTIFDSDQIITCGNEKYVYYWTIDGKLKYRADSNFKENFQITKFNDDILVFSKESISVQKKNMSFRILEGI